jgi:hypothetical protein
MESLLRERAIAKEYLCRVRGNFMEGSEEEVVCDMPIKIISPKLGLCSVADNGKACLTVFKRLHYNGRTSLVLCRPLTGRMHQIRVHLLWLGYHIANDGIYNDTRWKRVRDINGHVTLSIDNDDDNNIISSQRRPMDRITAVNDTALCEECGILRKDPEPHQLSIWLHALSYSGDTWSYISTKPIWAMEDFVGDQEQLIKAASSSLEDAWTMLSDHEEV